MAEISIEGVIKDYPDGHRAIHGVDLHLADGEFVVLRGIDKTAKLGLYQGIKRTFGEDVKMASARERDAGSESYTLVIGRSTDHDDMRALARKG